MSEERTKLNAPSGYVFIVFSKTGKPQGVGRNAEEAWGQLSGESMTWQYWRKWYRSKHGYFGKRISLHNGRSDAARSD